MRYYLSSYCTYCILVCLYTNHIDSYMGYEHLSAVLIRALPSNQKRAVHEDLNTVSNIRFYPISNSSKSNLTITLLKPIQLHLNCSKLCFTAIISIVSGLGLGLCSLVDGNISVDTNVYEINTTDTKRLSRCHWKTCYFCKKMMIWF